MCLQVDRFIFDLYRRAWCIVQRLTDNEGVFLINSKVYSLRRDEMKTFFVVCCMIMMKTDDILRMFFLIRCALPYDQIYRDKNFVIVLLVHEGRTFVFINVHNTHKSDKCKFSSSVYETFGY